MKKELGESASELEVCFGDVFEIRFAGDILENVVIDTTGPDFFAALALERGRKGKLFVAKIPGTCHLRSIHKATGERLSLEQIIQGVANFEKRQGNEFPTEFAKGLERYSKLPPLVLTK